MQVEQNIPKKQFLPVNYAGLFTVNDQNETKIKICLKWSYKYEAYKLSYDEPDKSYQAAGGFYCATGFIEVSSPWLHKNLHWPLEAIEQLNGPISCCDSELFSGTLSSYQEHCSNKVLLP